MILFEAFIAFFLRVPILNRLLSSSEFSKSDLLSLVSSKASNPSKPRKSIYHEQLKHKNHRQQIIQGLDKKKIKQLTIPDIITRRRRMESEGKETQSS